MNPRPRDWVAVILALGIAVGVNCITVAVLWDAIANPAQAGISENGTQVLTAVFGGITGILGGYIGFRAGETARGTPQAPDRRAAPPPPADHTGTAEKPSQAPFQHVP